MTDIHWQRIDLFKDLDPAQLELVKPVFREVVCEAGQKIIVEGQPGDEMYVLVDGTVRVTKGMLIKGMSLPFRELSSPRKVLATIGGEGYPILGEIALLDCDQRSATVEAVETCRLLSTDRDSFFELVRCHPDIGCILLTALGRRMASMVRHNNNEIVKLTSALALALSRMK